MISTLIITVDTVLTNNLHIVKFVLWGPPVIRVRNISLGDYSPGRHYDKYNEKTIIIQANSRFYRHISSRARCKIEFRKNIPKQKVAWSRWYDDSMQLFYWFNLRCGAENCILQQPLVVIKRLLYRRDLLVLLYWSGIEKCSSLNFRQQEPTYIMKNIVYILVLSLSCILR